MKFLLPARLQKGDKVAIVTPAWAGPYLFPHIYELGLKRIHDVFGLNPIVFPHAVRSPEYLIKNPQARADDINAAFADSSIKAIFSTVGGNDCIRILPYLKKDIIQSNPKIFLGYSDITNIHCYLWQHGLVSYYGGSVMNQFGMQGAMHEFTLNALHKALFETDIGNVERAGVWTDYDLDWADTKLLGTMRPMKQAPDWQWYNCENKVVSGRLWGGCLEVLDLQFAANNPSYLPTNTDFEQIVLYIETSEELPGDGFVYRFMAALGERGILEKLKGILVGIPKTQFLKPKPLEERVLFQGQQKQAILQALSDYDCLLPVVFNLNFGHTDPQLIIPNGGIACIDGIRETIRFAYE